MPGESAKLESWPLHLPTIAPQETLYSWCARYHRRAAGGNVLETSLALFENPHAGRLHDLPTDLAALSRRTGGQLGTARDLALQHTLLGYYLAFKTPSTAESLLSSVQLGPSRGLKMRLGLPASGCRADHPLKYCVECTAADAAKLGWPIWRLDHQLPTVLVCTTHLRPLVQLLSPRNPVRMRFWLTPGRHHGLGTTQIPIRGPAAESALLRLAQFSERAARSPPGGLSPTAMSEAYRAWARRNGTISAGGNLRHGAASTVRADGAIVLSQYLPAEFQGIAFDPSSIFASAARAKPRPQHPGKHLVLLCAMYSSWEEFQSDLDGTKSMPVEVDRIADPQPVGASVRARPSLDGKRQELLELLTRTSSVSEAARLAEVSVNTAMRWASQAGHVVKRRPKFITEEMLAAVRARLADGSDRLEVAEAFGISLVSINRLLSTEAGLCDAWHSARHRRQEELRRARFSQLVKANRDATASRLRRLAPADWVWLYRHDREWLRAQLPSLWAHDDADG